MLSRRPIVDLVVAVVRILRQVASARPVGLVVLFHRIGDRDGDPQRELVAAVGVATFRAQLRWSRRLFRPVPAGDILAAAQARRRWQRIPVAITFDDDWPTHVELALPVLRAEGIRATFFLTGAHIDGPAPFWWELLQDANDRGLDTGRIISGQDIFAQAALVTAGPPEQRAALTAALADLVGPEVAPAMSPEEIRRVAAEHDIGFHTLRHDALDTLTSAQLEASLSEGRQSLEALVSRRLTLLAYPHGAAGAREACAARDAGFALAFTTNWEPVGPQTDPLLVGRVEPGPVSPGRFLLTLANALIAHPNSRTSRSLRRWRPRSFGGAARARRRRRRSRPAGR